jgi:hypothetical protein
MAMKTISGAAASVLARAEDHAHVPVDDLARKRLDQRGVGEHLHHLVQDLPAVLGTPQVAAAEHDGDLDLVPVDEEAAGVSELRLQIVVVDVRAQLDLLDRDPAFLLPCLAGLLRGLEAVLAPVHDPHDDGARVGSHLDEIEAGFFR